MQKSVSPVVAIVVIIVFLAIIGFVWMRLSTKPTMPPMGGGRGQVQRGGSARPGGGERRGRRGGERGGRRGGRRGAGARGAAGPAGGQATDTAAPAPSRGR